MERTCVFCNCIINDNREYPVCDECMNLPYLKVKVLLNEKL
jgi:hypothetical protein